jgi:hypothetical protein
VLFSLILVPFVQRKLGTIVLTLYTGAGFVSKADLLDKNHYPSHSQFTVGGVFCQYNVIIIILMMMY